MTWGSIAIQRMWSSSLNTPAQESKFNCGFDHCFRKLCRIEDVEAKRNVYFRREFQKLF